MSASTRLYKQSTRLPNHQPLPWSVYLRGIIAKDPVLWISGALAVISSALVQPPLRAYAQNKKADLYSL